MKVFNVEFIYFINACLAAILVWVLYLSVKDEDEE